MRIRTIKPEFWRSDDITKLSREDRLLFIGLWSYVDDNGVGIDDHRQIAADLFALEEDQKEVRDYVRESLAKLSRALLIIRYEVDGKHYLRVATWDKHQRVDRPNRARYPLPPENTDPPASEDAEDGVLFATDSRESREGLATGTGEQGNSGTGDKHMPRGARPVDRFPEFYDTYPRKTGRRKAEQAWAAALKRDADPDQVIEAAKRYRAAWHGKNLKYAKHPSSWLNAECYLDSPAELRLVSGGYVGYQGPTDQSEYDKEF